MQKGWKQHKQHKIVLEPMFVICCKYTIGKAGFLCFKHTFMLPYCFFFVVVMFGYVVLYENCNLMVNTHTHIINLLTHTHTCNQLGGFSIKGLETGEGHFLCGFLLHNIPFVLKSTWLKPTSKLNSTFDS